MTRSRLLFQLFCQFVRYSFVFVIAVFVMFSPTQRYIFLNFLLLDYRNMVIFLFALLLFLSDVRPVTNDLRSPGHVPATPLPLHVRVRIHWTTTAVYPVCCSVTKPTRAYATRATSCCLLTDSTCVRPSLLSVFISSALPQAISVVAGQRGNAPTVVVVASRAGLSPTSSATGRHPSPGPSALSLHRPPTVPDVSQLSVTRTVTMRYVTLI